MSGTNNGSSGGYSSIDRWLGESTVDAPWNAISPRDYVQNHHSNGSKDKGGKGKDKDKKHKSRGKSSVKK